MSNSYSGVDPTLFLFFIAKSPTFSSISALVIALLFAALWFFPGGIAWAFSRSPHGFIPGPPGFVFAIAGSTAHRVLARMAQRARAVPLMGFSVGFTRFIVSSHPDVAREILNSSSFVNRPIKESAYELLFHRAMGFAPFGDYWRMLRRVSATHLFCPRRIAAFSNMRSEIGVQMLHDVRSSMESRGFVDIKQVLHFGSLNNIMTSVFGKSYDFGQEEGKELEGIVREGFELLGVFNWGDHFPLLGYLDLRGIRRRCRKLVGRVNLFVGKIIKEHRSRRDRGVPVGFGDFVDVLLDLEEEEKLSESDMIAVLWEMIFRGTDTVAILIEWIMARMVLHPEVQLKAQVELDNVVGNSRTVSDSDIPKLPFLQAIVKETIRMHPPGPLLSWARLAVHDVHVRDHFIPAGTTAMVNMWAIAHDGANWSEPYAYRPERFMDEDVSIMGSDLRLAPFGSGRRVCPGKALGLATVHLWLAQLLQSFRWVPSDSVVDLTECLKLSMEMKSPLVCKAVARSQ